MTLGEKLRQARLEAGLSQRQLCGEEVTRNMLSQIENGVAMPSMGTLSYFARQLGKPVSYFLQEDTVSSPNQQRMEQARAALREGRGTAVLEILKDYRRPDPLFDGEAQLLERLAALLAAEERIEKGQFAYGAELLEEAWADGYCAKELDRKRLLLLAKARPKLLGEIVRQLPSLDEELLLRARYALDRGELDRCQQLLEAAQDRETAQWNFLRGEVHLAKRKFAPAAECFRKAEGLFPEKCAVRLERCYRELGDFRQAYYYACKRRGEE